MVTLADPQTWDMYEYAHNNPTTLTDPSGLHGACSAEVANQNGGCEPASTAECGGGEEGPGPCSQNSALENRSQNPVNGGKDPTPAQQQLSWSSLSGGQQALVSGGAKAWGKMSTDARANFAAITNVLGEEGLLSEVQSASMRPDAREMNVVWKAGAEKAFEKAGYHQPLLGDPLHNGVSLHQQGNEVEGLHAVFPSGSGHESQVHIDYRGGFAHFGTPNDDVLDNEEEYKKWYGPLPGLSP